MVYDTAKEFWTSYIRMANKGFSYKDMKNPALDFVKKAKRGDYDRLSDEEYNEKLEKVQELSSFWDNNSQNSVGNILLTALNKTELSNEQIDQIANILSEASTNTDYLYMENNTCNNPNWNSDTHTSKDTLNAQPYLIAQFDQPNTIYNYLDDHIYGQKSAKKAAAMLVYNHLHESRRNIVMAGATGCGKTEIWRTLAKRYDFIQIINGPQIAGDGWYGSYHIKDIFWHTPQEIREKLIIVIDEADKMLEPQIGSHGTDHAILIQNELLKIMDGDTITFTDKNNNSITVDCSNVSIVFCGSFEHMLRKKTEISKNIGFGKPEKTESQIAECTEEDLIKYGNMRREIAGRINQIVCLDTLNADDFEHILQSEISPIHQIETTHHISLSINKNSYKQLAADAANSGLGCRYIRSKLQSLLDEKMFENPNNPTYDLQYK